MSLRDVFCRRSNLLVTWGCFAKGSQRHHFLGAIMEVKPVTLQGQHVRLEPMTEAHISGLAQVGVGQAFWDFLLYGDMTTDADLANWVRDILSRAEKGTDLPFVAIHLASGQVAGATRYLNIMPKDRGLEIGGTWYGSEFQRTP